MGRFWNPDEYPYSIDWAAWATLVVGIVAVVGAIWIGLRQAAIAHRQTKILERQADFAASQVAIEETRLRAELYDRRIIIYAAIDQYWAEVSSNDGKASKEVTEGLFEALSVAQFLLDNSVEFLGRDMWNTAVKLKSEMGKLERVSVEKDRDAVFSKIEKLNDRLVEIRNELQVSKSQYLRLSEPAPS